MFAVGRTLGLLLGLSACDLVYPEVAVVNNIDPQILVRNPSFNGCLWEAVLAYGESTAPHACPPGEDQIHFGKLDLRAYGSSGTTPVWFNYQTTAGEQAAYGGSYLFEIPPDIEQDFSVPGPYGH